jgi:hypothetical protein
MKDTYDEWQKAHSGLDSGVTSCEDEEKRDVVDSHEDSCCGTGCSNVKENDSLVLEQLKRNQAALISRENREGLLHDQGDQEDTPDNPKSNRSGFTPSPCGSRECTGDLQQRPDTGVEDEAYPVHLSKLGEEGFIRSGAVLGEEEDVNW